jgi:hypothetical protein
LITPKELPKDFLPHNEYSSRLDILRSQKVKVQPKALRLLNNTFTVTPLLRLGTAQPHVSIIRTRLNQSERRTKKMKKRYTLIGSLILLALLGGNAFWNTSRSTAHTNPPPVSNDAASNPLVAINQKARAARSGDETATREFVDEMFRMFDFATEFAELDESVKDRLVQAQLNYSGKRGKNSCSEQRIVHAVNRLADRIGTPAYTRTNVFEVRRLRANLLLITPELQGPRYKTDLRQGQKQKPLMSPLEAFFVAGMLIQQKRHNPEYQLTNTEWIALHGGKRIEGGSKKFDDEMKQRHVASTRTEEVRQAVYKGVGSMSPFDLLQLPAELLDTLGIER